VPTQPPTVAQAKGAQVADVRQGHGPRLLLAVRQDVLQQALKLAKAVGTLCQPGHPMSCTRHPCQPGQCTQSVTKIVDPKHPLQKQ
jgi:hypothetical protein